MRRRFKATISIAMTLALLFAETVRYGNITGVLADSPKGQKPKGLGLRKTQMSFSALIGAQDHCGRSLRRSEPASRPHDYPLRRRFAGCRGDSSRLNSNAAGGRRQPA